MWQVVVELQKVYFFDLPQVQKGKKVQLSNFQFSWCSSLDDWLLSSYGKVQDLWCNSSGSYCMSSLAFNSIKLWCDAGGEGEKLSTVCVSVCWCSDHLMFSCKTKDFLSCSITKFDSNQRQCVAGVWLGKCTQKVILKAHTTPQPSRWWEKEVPYQCVYIITMLSIHFPHHMAYTTLPCLVTSI